MKKRGRGGNKGDMIDSLKKAIAKRMVENWTLEAPNGIGSACLHEKVYVTNILG